MPAGANRVDGYELIRIAYHEAAHAVVATACGFPVQRARIRTLDEALTDGEGNTVNGLVELDKPVQEQQRWMSATGWRDLAAMHLAGGLGPLLVDGKADGPTSCRVDHERAAWIAGFIARDDPAQFLRDAKADALELLYQFQPAVDEIARRLVAHHWVTAPEIAAVVERSGGPSDA